MTDKDGNGNNNDGKGTDPEEGKKAADEKKEGGKKKERTFTQAELDGHFAAKTKELEGKYADYDDIKAKAAKLDEIEEAAKSDLQKSEDATAKAEKERDEALKQAHDTLIRAAFIAEGSKQGLANPERGDAYALADLAGVKVEDGTVTGVDEAVKALIKESRLPLAKKPAPGLDDGAGNGDKSEVKKLTAEELEVAKKMNLTPEQYALSKASPKSTPEMGKLKEKDKKKE